MTDFGIKPGRIVFTEDGIPLLLNEEMATSLLAKLRAAEDELLHGRTVPETEGEVRGESG